MKKLQIVGTLAICTLSACSSIIKGANQDIAIDTNPAGANCSLTRQGSATYHVNPTPGNITIKKTMDDIVVKCSKPGYHDAVHVNHSGIAPALFGNILIGGLVGVGIDFYTGAANNYDSPVSITLNPDPSSPIAENRPPTTIAAPAPPQIPPEERLPDLQPNRIKGKSHPSDLALIIGVDRYDHFPRADFAEDDATSFAAEAVGAMGITPNKVKILRGTEATRTTIMKSLATWAKAEMVPGKSTVYVFFSGHGLASVDGRDAFLAPFGTDLAVLTDSAVRREEVIARLNEAGAKNIVMMLDTCYSGISRGGQTLVAYARPMVIKVLAGPSARNVTVLSAGAVDQISSGLPAARHGAFSYWLMRGIEGEAAPEGRRKITLSDLATFVRDRVAKDAIRMGRQQVPEISGDAAGVIVEW